MDCSSVVAFGRLVLSGDVGWASAVSLVPEWRLMFFLYRPMMMNSDGWRSRLIGWRQARVHRSQDGCGTSGMNGGEARWIRTIL